MRLNSFRVEQVDLARDHYLNNDKDLALSVLSRMDFDTDHIEKEINEKEGNTLYLNNYLDSTSDSVSGFFKCSYYPQLSIECSFFNELSPTIKILNRFHNIRCVRQTFATKGIAHEQIVAIFPENFNNVVAETDYPVFYFANKFSKRHLTYTRPFLKKSKFKSIFLPILSLPLGKIEDLITNWVNMHEISHRMGLMPIPRYLFEKSNSFTAALEELRADVKTINTLLLKNKSCNSDDYLTALFVLSERLCSYPLFRISSNFDCISSVFFWKFLVERGFFANDLVQDGLMELESFIEGFEKIALLESTAIQRKEKLRNLILGFFGDYDQQYINYKNFWGMK